MTALPATPLAAVAARPAAVRLRLVPTVRTAALTPFLALVGLLLIVGLAALLVVNTALARNSFDVTELRSEVARLEVQQTELAADLARLESPGELAQRAARLGMQPGGIPRPLVPAEAAR